MGKNALKMRIKKVPDGFAVQYLRKEKYMTVWQTLDIYSTPQDCVNDYPYQGVVRDAKRYLWLWLFHNK